MSISHFIYVAIIDKIMILFYTPIARLSAGIDVLQVHQRKEKKNSKL